MCNIAAEVSNAKSIVMNLSRAVYVYSGTASTSIIRNIEFWRKI